MHQKFLPITVFRKNVEDICPEAVGESDIANGYSTMNKPVMISYKYYQW